MVYFKQTFTKYQKKEKSLSPNPVKKKTFHFFYQN